MYRELDSLTGFSDDQEQAAFDGDDDTEVDQDTKSKNSCICESSSLLLCPKLLKS